MSVLISTGIAVLCMGTWLIILAKDAAERSSEILCQRTRAPVETFVLMAQNELHLNGLLSLFQAQLRLTTASPTCQLLYPNPPSKGSGNTLTWPTGANDIVISCNGLLYKDILEKGVIYGQANELLTRFQANFIVAVIHRKQVIATLRISLGRTTTLNDQLEVSEFHQALNLAYTNLRLNNEVQECEDARTSEQKAKFLALATVPEMTNGSIAGLSWLGHFAPAYHPGSTFSDVYEIDQGRLLVSMGSGLNQTLAGAMIAAVLKSCCDEVLLESPIAPSPANLLEILNTSLYRHNGVARGSCVFIVWDPARSVITYANAGHPAPLHLHRKSDVTSVTTLETPGAVLGLEYSPNYTEHSLNMEPEDTLVLFTTGLLEAKDKAGETFGLQRLLVVLESLPTTDREWVKEQILTAITLYSHDEKLSNDHALLVVSSCGQADS